MEELHARSKSELSDGQIPRSGFSVRKASPKKVTAKADGAADIVTVQITGSVDGKRKKKGRVSTEGGVDMASGDKGKKTKRVPPVKTL